MSSNIKISNLATSQSQLFLILLVATLVRCWNIWNIPYTHDEMSAILRTNFNSFSELIELGVRTDTHPAGVQVFMYYWTSFFGLQNWIVKLPFIIMGVTAIYYSYKVATIWFNESIALISCSFIAVLQFPVMYSQIARPYVSGLFLIMGFTYYLTRLVQIPNYKLIHLIFAILLGSLCAYNHHFSLLLAGLIGLSFIITSSKAQLKPLLLLSIGIIALYLPHIGIFVHQLDKGGVGQWLGKPTWDFGWQFLKYTFHYSFIILALVTATIATPLVLKKKNNQFSKKWFWICLGITVGYFCIGFFYSILKNPIIQFSILLYTLPFLLFVLFSSLPKMSNKVNLLLVCSILFIGSTSLILERNHYYTFYNTRYFQMIDDMQSSDSEQSNFILCNIPEFVEFYQSKNADQPISFRTYDKDTSSIRHFENLLDNCNKDLFMLGLLEQCPKELLTLSLHKYPFVIKKAEYHGAATYWLSSKGESNQTLTYYNHNVNFDNRQSSKALINNNELLWDKDSRTYACNKEEYNLGVQMNLKNTIKHRYDIIEVNANVRLDSLSSEMQLVVEFYSNDKKVGRRSSSTQNFKIDNDGNCHLTVAIDRNGIDAEFNEELSIKSYIWNLSLGAGSISELNINIIEGNRNKYCLYDPIYNDS